MTQHQINSAYVTGYDDGFRDFVARTPGENTDPEWERFYLMGYYDGQADADAQQFEVKARQYLERIEANEFAPPP